MTKTRWAVVAAILGLGFLAECRLAALSPHDEIKSTSTTDIETGAGSTTTVFNFQSVAAKGGWFATPLTLAGWIVATIRSRRREKAADDLILSIESVGDASRLVRSQVRARQNAYITKRVTKLCPKKLSN